MTKPKYKWHTDYVLEAKYKAYDDKWLLILKYDDQQSAMDEMQDRIKKYGDTVEYRVMQQSRVEVSTPEEPSDGQQELDDLRTERDKLRDTLVETLIIYLDMHKRISDSLTEMRDYLTGGGES